jgi:L-serine deaminase
MIDTPFTSTEPTAEPKQEALRQYVRALLARQQALDLLETIHAQINQVWTVMRKLLDDPGAKGPAAKALRIARAALATKAQQSYHQLERRRDDCIAALHQAERRANASLQFVLTANAKKSPRKARSSSTTLRRKFKNTLAAAA